ncbi:MAG: hypothetical protein HY064_09405 [Bacteroidetes bacterium]|nr:hypothetical protein [Bacteroidota bacterium]
MVKKNRFFPFLTVVVLAFSCHPVKPVAVYETLHHNRKLFLYDNQKFILLRPDGNFNFKHAIGHYSADDSTVDLRNYYSTGEYSYQYSENKNGKAKGKGFYVVYDFSPDEVNYGVANADFTFTVNDTLKVNFKIEHGYPSFLYGKIDSTLSLVRSLQLKENNSCFTTETFMVSDTTANEFIVHLRYMPPVYDYSKYIWGYRNGIFSPNGDTLYMNTSSCNGPDTGVDTLVKNKNLRQFRKWPFELLGNDKPVFLARDN